MLSLFLLLLISTQASAALPPEAQKVIDSLPSKALTLEFVMGQAIGVSDSFQAISSQSYQVEVARLQAEAALDYQVKLSANYLDSKLQNTSGFQRNSLTRGLSLGASTLFRTGTLMSAEVGHGHLELGPVTTVGIVAQELWQTSAKLSLEQNLWKDAFGYATRRSLEAGEMSSKSAQAAFDESVEDWFIQMLGIFYEAQFAQSRVRASMATVSRQRRLMDITKVKARRGTAEKPDVIQVESNFTKAQLAESEAREKLAAIWRELVVALKLPESWLQIDPLLVPIKPQDPVAPVLEACGPKTKVNPPPKDSTATLKATRLADAARLASESAENMANPSLKFGVSLQGNALDESGAEAVSQTLGLNNPAWGASLILSMPLGFSAEEASVRAARADFLRADALASDAVNRLRVQWLNECLELHRIKERVDILQRSFENQLQRTRLEERRFQLGRSQALQVIQADSDAIDTELLLHDAQKQIQLTAWGIRKLMREIRPYLERAVKRAQSIALPKNEASWRSVRSRLKENS